MALAVLAKREGDACGARAAGAADAMDIRFGIGRQIVIDDVADAVDIEAASGNVGGYENVQPAVAETGQHSFAGGLRLVAVDGVGFDALLFKLAGDLIGAVLGTGEDQGTMAVGVADDLIQQRLLVAVFDEVNLLFDALDRGGRRRNADRHRIVQQAVGQARNVVGHSGRKEQRLPFGGQMRNDALEIGEEAHIEHAVGFVEDEHFQFVQADAALRRSSRAIGPAWRSECERLW